MLESWNGSFILEGVALSRQHIYIYYVCMTLYLETTSAGATGKRCDEETSARFFAAPLPNDSWWVLCKTDDCKGLKYQSS